MGLLIDFYVWMLGACIKYERPILVGVMASLGVMVRIAVLKQQGEPMPPARIFAITVSGLSLAETVGPKVVMLLGMPDTSVAGMSFIVGFIGMNFMDMILDRCKALGITGQADIK